MAQMIRTDRRVNQAALVGFVLLAALVAGVVGGLVGARLTTAGGAQAAAVAPRAATTDWAAYGATWQQQYEQQHPTTVGPAMVKYGIEWQRQYEQQHPTTLNPALVQAGIDWQRQYEQVHPQN